VTFRLGHYVRVKKSRFILTGTIIAVKDFQGRYLVKYDQSANASVLEQGLLYEDELERCESHKKV
jgi:hypothetical protein